MIRRFSLLSLLTIIFVTFVSAQKTEPVKNENSVVAMMVKQVSAEEVAKTALNVGSKIPSFTLKDAMGVPVSSDDLLKQGNLVIVFYRGSWCPYCNLYLHKLQQYLSQIKEKGGILVAISVENPDKSLAIVKKNELNFTVLSDPKLTTARAFGLVYQMSLETDELYKSKYDLNIAQHNNMEKPELPLSATYVVNQKGEIVYAFLEPDYKKRAEPQIVIETLAKMNVAKPIK